VSRLVGPPVNRIGTAVAIMRKEGVEQDQAVAKAYAMEKAGKLREDGSYIKAK
jgi:hypothetical protein